MGSRHLLWICLLFVGHWALARTYEVEERSPINLPLSFEELSQLKPADRINYIRELREILADVESAQESQAPSQASWNALPKFFPTIFRLAVAEDAHSKTASYICIHSDKGVRNTSYVADKAACDTMNEKGQSERELPQVQGSGSDAPRSGTPAALPQPQTVVDRPYPIKSSRAQNPLTAPSGKPADGAPLPPKRPKGDQDQACVDNTGPTSALSCKPNCRKHAAFYKSLRETKKADCLVGGVFSEYADGQVRVGNCKSKGMKIGQTEVKCDAGLSLCNPLLYCGEEKDGKFQPLCLKATQTLTRSCDEKSKGRACDPLKSGLSKADYEKAWNEFVEKHGELCKEGSEFAKFFCDECNLLSQKIASLNRKVQGGGSPATPGQTSRPQPATR